MSLKLIRMEYNIMFKEWNLLTSSNGYQWTGFFAGTKQDALVLFKAFKSIGYKKENK